jgi:hypothetical protein
MRLAPLSVVVAIAVSAPLSALSAGAATCPAPADAPNLASVDAERRLAFVESALDRAEAQSAKWGGFWRATFQTTAAVQFSLAHVAKRDADRIDLIAGGIKSSTGLVFAWVFRLPAEKHEGPWAERPWREGALCDRLASAEEALERDAKFEKRGRSIGMQALGLGFNVAVGVTTYLMHKRLWSVLLGMVTGGIVGEIRVFTQPTVASDAIASYKTGVAAKTAWSVLPTVMPHPGGGELGVALTF